jgi:uncharacterized membrane protein (UPF0127 family)
MGEFLKNIFLAWVFFSIVSPAAFARDLDKLYAKSEFKIGTHKFSAYIADDESLRAQGLMFIEKIPDDGGMLFVFEDERPLGFWMKNTLIPLSIGFFDARGVLIDIQEMKVAASIMEMSPPSYQSKGPALFALEMNTGWFARHAIKTGSHLVRLTKSNSRLLNQKLPLPKSARH